MSATVDELKKLHELLEQGIITQEEYDKKKKSILNQPEASSACTPACPPADSKNKIAAGLLAIFLGSLGIHKFYLGYTQAGLIMFLVSILGSFLFFLGPAVMGIIALIEGIIYLTKTDQQFYEIYVVGKKPWF